MDEAQFMRLLGLFPMVRTRDYCANEVASNASSMLPDFEPLGESLNTLQITEERAVGDGDKDTSSAVEPMQKLTAKQSQNTPVSFWELMQQQVEAKFGQAEAERFCDAFRAQHNELVNDLLSLDSIERIAKNLWPNA